MARADKKEVPVKIMIFGFCISSTLWVGREVKGDSMLKLHFAPNCRAGRVLWLLEE